MSNDDSRRPDRHGTDERKETAQPLHLEAAEHERTAAESARQGAERHRASREEARELSEQCRQELELARQENESLRMQAERVRQTAEAHRQVAIESLVGTAEALSANLTQMQFLVNARKVFGHIDGKPTDEEP